MRSLTLLLSITLSTSLNLFSFTISPDLYEVFTYGNPKFNFGVPSDKLAILNIEETDLWQYFSVKSCEGYIIDLNYSFQSN